MESILEWIGTIRHSSRNVLAISRSMYDVSEFELVEFLDNFKWDTKVLMS